MALSYKDAGVDLELYDDAMARIPALIGRTQTPRVLPLTGGFAGLFQLQGAGKKYRDPVLVSGTDGVGTKVKVAMAAGVFNTVGIDLVAMCVNDCLCLGAEPLFFLDYLALGKDNPDLIATLVEGVSEGCLQAGAALIGGETAIMPDVYAAGDFDMAGFCVGVAERDQLVDGKAICDGDVLLGIDSSGIHSNGFSLVRKIVFGTVGLGVHDDVPELGKTVSQALLTPTKIYADIVMRVMSGDLRSSVSGIAHITGGGLVDNIERIIPAGLQAQVDRATWQVPAIFNWLQRLGDVEREEMFRVFNMGIGLTLIVRPQAVTDVAQLANSLGYHCRQIGQVRPGATQGTYLN